MLLLFAVLMNFLVYGNALSVTIFKLYIQQSNSAIHDGHWLAIQEINNNPNILSNYTLNLRELDGGIVSNTVITETLNAVDIHSHNNKTHVSFPIVLGTSLSFLCIVMNPILASFNMGQISSGATSISLSDTSKYPYFYRTLPNDAMQVEGLIYLCKRFNWTSIFVVYINDNYGEKFTLSIQQLASQNDISATSIAVSHEPASYIDAAKKIKELQIYVIFMIVYSGLDESLSILDYFKNESITSYPYYILGSDAFWGRINHHTYVKGYIGTDTAIRLSQDKQIQNLYSDEILKMRTQSELRWENMYTLIDKYSNHTKINVNDTVVAVTSAQYDSMYTIAHIIDKLGDLSEWLLDKDETELIQEMNRIITEEISFIGATGNISFDENGDKVNALAGFVNIDHNGTLQYFGYMYEHNNGSYECKINESLIIWPDEFVKKGMIPRTDILVYDELQTVNKSEAITIIIFMKLSIILSLFYIIFWFIKRKNTIIKAASFKFNIIMCCGSILGYCAGIIMAIQEYFIDNNDHDIADDILCNLRFWLFIISYSLLFMPLFVKTYRLSRIFKTSLQKKKVTDTKLFVIILIAIAIDLILLTICTSIRPSHRILYNGEYEIIDELQARQYKYGTCSMSDSDNPFNWSFYAILLFCNACQLLWGLYIGFDVSRIKDITGMLSRFDETGIQLLSILFTVIIICIDIPIYIFGPIQNPHFYFLIITITILLIGNIVIILNLSPRMIAVITGNEIEYKLSAAQRIEARINKHLGYTGYTRQTSTITSTPTTQTEMVNTIPSTENKNFID